jgi:hypothetical protein
MLNVTSRKTKRILAALRGTISGGSKHTAGCIADYTIAATAQLYRVQPDDYAGAKEITSR